MKTACQGIIEAIEGDIQEWNNVAKEFDFLVEHLPDALKREVAVFARGCYKRAEIMRVHRDNLAKLV